MEEALFIGIFPTGLGLKLWAFPPTHWEKQQNVFFFFSKHHVWGARACAWCTWHLGRVRHAWGAYFNLFFLPFFECFPSLT